MLDIITHYGNSTDNHNELPRHPLKWLKFKRLIKPNDGEAAEQFKVLNISDRNAKMYGYFGNRSAVFL